MRAVLMGACTAVAGLALAGCSQVSALAPVSGGPITTLRTAVYDVLLESSVEILVAPVCTETTADPVAYSCAGTTVTGEEITVSASGTPMSMTVRVADRVVHDGPIQPVIDRAAEVPQ